MRKIKKVFEPNESIIAWNRTITETNKMDQSPPITNHYPFELIQVNICFLTERSAKMIDGTEKPKIPSKFAKWAVRNTVKLAVKCTLYTHHRRHNCNKSSSNLTFDSTCSVMKLRCEASPLQHVQYASLFYKCFSLEAASILYLHQSAVCLSLWQQILYGFHSLVQWSVFLSGGVYWWENRYGTVESQRKDLLLWGCYIVWRWTSR